MSAKHLSNAARKMLYDGYRLTKHFSIQQKAAVLNYLIHEYSGALNLPADTAISTVSEELMTAIERTSQAEGN